MIKKYWIALAVVAAMFAAGCRQETATTVVTEFVPSPSDVFMVVKPMDVRTYMGGIVTLLPRLYYIGPDGEAKYADIKLTNVRMLLNGQMIFEETVSNFWTKYNFLPYKNGDYSFEAIGVSDQGCEYRMATNITVSNVPVVFRAHLREPLVQERKLYMAGSSPALAIMGDEYNPRGAQFKKIDPLTYELTLTLGMMETLKYELTCGNWAIKAYDSNNTYIQGIAKVTSAGQVFDIYIDNFGVTNGKMASTGYIVGFTSPGSEFTVNYIHKTTNAVTLYWSWDGWQTVDSQMSKPSQYCLFRIPAQYGRTLVFTFSGEKKTNTMDIPYNNVPFQFLSFGDSHNQNSGVIRRMGANEHPAFVVNTGDLVYDGFKASDWDLFVNNTRPVLSKFLFQPQAGNHDAESPFWSLVTGKPWWYSFTWANCYFIGIDNSAPFDPGTTQYKWIESELQKAKYYPFVIVFMHYPPYSARRHYGDTPSQTILVPLFEKYAVDVVLTGHNHGYEASYPLLRGVRNDEDGIVYVVSGGGGGTLYDLIERQDWMRFEKKIFNYMRASVTDKEITFEAVDENGNVFDSFVVKK